MKELLYILPSLVVGLGVGFIIRLFIGRISLKSAEQVASKRLEEADKEIEQKKKEALLEAKGQILREKNEFEREHRERRIETQKLEKRLLYKEENLERKLEKLEKRDKNLGSRERVVADKEKELEELLDNQKKELERISGMSSNEAKELLIQSIEREARTDAAVLVNKIETEAKQLGEKKARNIITSAMQRTASETVAERSVSSVNLPNDEMKGRIIGREGRNIRALETMTGVDIIIDDTPEAIVLSCFEPVRREIARVAIEKLISDGRIHPARIEEVVEKTRTEIEEVIMEEGERACFDLNLQGINTDLQRHIGRLKYRYSYGQNILNHSIEVAHIAGIIAGEVGANVEVCKTAGLLHDIGKGVIDGEGGHATIGADIARKLGARQIVVNAIASHHFDVDPETPEAVIVQIADAISASRPGARKESFDNYVKRLENLERIATDFSSVEKAYAIQAGRELRIIMEPNGISDEEIKETARGIARRIEDELKYPGQIKVTAIKETRIVEFTK
jgi:ribonuclease Y